mmetsp:Transcript_43141/g.101109  ORF Transcript_43141/g.101109 Transcript_43141/m.101109 type:complete len:125 (-) Transcript_43141:275-649(-)
MAKSRAASTAAAAATQPPNKEASFHMLTTVPPLLLLRLCVSTRSIALFFPAWAVCRYATKRFGVGERYAAFGAQALAVYASYEVLDADIVSVDWRLPLAVCVGLVMSVAYKNLFAAVYWMVTVK